MSSLSPLPTRRVPLALAVLALCIGCGPDGPAGPAADAPEIRGNASLGLEAFVDECASCHAAHDGFDLAFFAFPDTTIVRRAVAHVDTSTAHDIVAYVRTVRALETSRDLRIFQPGETRASGDANFATRLFGADHWPPELTAEDLRAIDPLDVPVALDFPLWSEEGSNLDWMPDRPVDDALLDHVTEFGAARTHLDRYRATGGEESLLLSVLALRLADRDPANPDAPCVMEPFDRFRPLDCFETRRWTSSLVAQDMLRRNERGFVHAILHDGWWDVGNAARRSRQTGAEIDRSVENWAQWMYLGWAFDPSRHASVYLSTALTRLGLPRHATFHALRAMVARGPNGAASFKDVRTTARFAPDHWTFEAVRFGLEHLADRLEAGITMRRQEQIDDARAAVTDAWAIASRRLASGAERDTLAALRDEVLAGLDLLVPATGA